MFGSDINNNCLTDEKNNTSGSNIFGGLQSQMPHTKMTLFFLYCEWGWYFWQVASDNNNNLKGSWTWSQNSRNVYNTVHFINSLKGVGILWQFLDVCRFFCNQSSVLLLFEWFIPIAQMIWNQIAVFTRISHGEAGSSSLRNPIIFYTVNG